MPRSVRAVVATERQETEVVFLWAKAHDHIEPRLALLFCIPNGQYRRGTRAEVGIRRGFPDLCLPVPRGDTDANGRLLRIRSPGLFIEMKRRRAPPSAVSEAQRAWIQALRCQGYRVEVCRGADEAIAEIRSYLEMR